MGWVDGTRRGLWIKIEFLVDINYVDLQEGAFLVVMLDEEVPTVVQGVAKGVGLQERTHKDYLLVISDPYLILTTPQTCWTFLPSLILANLHLLPMIHPAQLPLTTGLLHFPNGAQKEQMQEWRVQHILMAPVRGLLTPMEV